MLIDKFWQNHECRLDKMSWGDLVRVFFLYPAVQVYLIIGVAALIATFALAQSPWPPLIAAVLAAAAYPVVWYLLHRFVLHGKFLYKSPLTARLWKRIHFDHHREPTNLKVLFGALHTTMPTIMIVVLPVGYAIGGFAGMAAATASGMAMVCFYEFMHCMQHLPLLPKSAFLRKIKRLHLAHHYHDETGNYGITNFMVDRALGTFYAGRGDRPRSATALNLGYAGEERMRYPWVAELTPDLPAIDEPDRVHLDRERRKEASATAMDPNDDGRAEAA